MACIFCDQTPETENAVEALAAIKKTLNLTPESTPEQVQDQVLYLAASNEARDGVIAHEKSRRKEAERLALSYRERLQELENRIAEDMNRRTTPPVYRGPSSAPSRSGGGMWGHQEEAFRKWDDYMPYIEKPNGKSGRFAMSYGHTSKKDRTR